MPYFYSTFRYCCGRYTVEILLFSDLAKNAYLQEAREKEFMQIGTQSSNLCNFQKKHLTFKHPVHAYLAVTCRWDNFLEFNKRVGPNKAVYRVGHSELKRHVKACYSLSIDFVFTKIHMGIVQNLMDKNIPKHFDPASNWPHQKLSSKDSQKYIKPMSEMPKKEEFSLGFHANILLFNNCFYGFKKYFQA